MIDTLLILDILYSRLIDSPLDDAASGEIYKNVRPQSSELEDIVINCLPITNDMIQMATANVNIYVKDVMSMISGIDQYMPNISRMQTLSELAITRLKNINAVNYWYDITSQGIIQENETHQHFINIRIEFKYINL